MSDSKIITGVASADVVARADVPADHSAEAYKDLIERQARALFVSGAGRFDSLFEAQEALEFVHGVTFDVREEMLLGDMFVPSIPTAGPADTVISFDSYEGLGAAKVSSRDSRSDAPRVSTKKTQESRNTVFYHAARGWTWNTLLQANNSRDPASRRQMEQEIRQVTRAMMVTRDDLIFSGHPAMAASTGAVRGSFAKDSAVQVHTGGVDISTYPTVTGEAIINMVQAAYNVMKTNTNNQVIRHRNMRLVLPPTEYGVITSASYSTASLTFEKSIAQVLLERLPWLTSIEEWPQLATADVAGTGPRAILYPANTPEVVALQDPLMPTPQAPFQVKTGEFEQETWGITGGCTWFYPLEGIYIDSI